MFTLIRNNLSHILVQEDAIKVIVKSGLPEIYVNLLVIIYLMDNTKLDQVKFLTVFCIIVSDLKA